VHVADDIGVEQLSLLLALQFLAANAIGSPMRLEPETTCLFGLGAAWESD
jgi:hypothetical protein